MSCVFECAREVRAGAVHGGLEIGELCQTCIPRSNRMRRACWRSLAVISSTGRCAAIPGASLLSSYTVVPARGVSRGIGGCSMLLGTALSCLINVVVGGAGLMRVPLRQNCRETPLEI